MAELCPHISYVDASNGALKHAYQDAGGVWHTETVDGDAVIQAATGIAADSSGYVHISYIGETVYLKYAYQDASGWHIETVDGSANIKRSTAIAIDSNDYPHISYQDREGDDSLRYAYKDVDGWHLEIADDVGIVGRYSSIALDSNNYPRISYQDWTNGYPDYRLKYAYKDGDGWHTEILYSTYTCGEGTSIALDGNDYVHIVWWQYIFWWLSRWRHSYQYDDSLNWGQGKIESARIGQFPSLALASDGQPHSSCYDDEGYDLEYAYRDPGGWNRETVDSDGNVGKYTSIDLDDADYPHVSYFDETNDDLKYAYKDGDGWHIATIDSDGSVGYFTSIVLAAPVALARTYFFLA